MICFFSQEFLQSWQHNFYNRPRIFKREFHLELFHRLCVEVSALVALRDGPVAPVGDRGSHVVGGQRRVLAHAVGNNLQNDVLS